MQHGKGAWWRSNMASTFFMKKFAVVPFNLRTSLPSESPKCRKEGTLTYYCKVVSDLLDMHGTHGLMTETDNDIM